MLVPVPVPVPVRDCVTLISSLTSPAVVESTAATAVEEMTSIEESLPPSVECIRLKAMGFWMVVTTVVARGPGLARR